MIPLFNSLVNSGKDLTVTDKRMTRFWISMPEAIKFICDSFVLMKCDSDKYIYGPHLNASYQIYQKNKKSLKFINEYFNFCKIENIITDTPNEHGPNYPGYYDHRHDQSVLSLLAIKNNINPLIDPSEWGNKCGNRGFNQLFIHHRNPNYILR